MNNNWILCFCDFETTGVDPRKDQPIEVACIWTDFSPELNELNRFQTLIKPSGDSGRTWRYNEWDAHKVHGIDCGYCFARGWSRGQAGGGIWKICNSLSEKHGLQRLPILISDNAWFETQFMRRLMVASGRRWPFHYCSWDTSLLLEVVGVGDPPKEEVVHRAMPDTEQLLEYTRRAISEVRR